MSNKSKSPVNLLSEQNHDLIQKCIELNIKRRAPTKRCKKSLLNISHRLDELAQTKKSHLLNVFEHNLKRSIFEIENFLNMLYHRENQTPNQAIFTMKQSLNQQKNERECKKHEISNLKLLIHGKKKKYLAALIDYFVNAIKEFCLRRNFFKLNIESTSIQKQINQKFCQLSEELDFDSMKLAFKPVHNCSNEDTEGLLQLKEYFPPIQSIGPNHVGQTLVWQTISSKYNCEQDVAYYSFNYLDNIFEDQQSASVFNIEANLDTEIIKEQKIDSSMFKMNKEDCEQLKQKSAVFQVEKARIKAMRAMKKKPDDWKCLLNACKTQKWEVNWVDNDKKK